MQSQAKSTSICQTCNHVSECTHYQKCQNEGKAIFQCENFDNKPVLHIVENKLLHEDTLSKLTKTSVSYIQGRMKGLCINCEKRVSCGYPIRDGGIWHCEEYC